MRLDPEQEAERRRYDLEDRPWWRDVLRAAVDVGTRTVALPASTQVGKTLTLIVLILYLAKHAPATAMAVFPDEDSAREFRDRLYADAAASGFAIPKPWRWNLQFCIVGSMRINLAWSGARSKTRSRRCKYVFLSELDVFASRGGGGDPVESAKQRVKAFPRHLIYLESSPTAEVSRIDQAYSGTDQRVWWCECPDCGTSQPLRFFLGQDGRGGVGGLKDAAGNWIEADAARTAAHYVCVSGCVLGDERKADFVRRGKWVSGRKESGPDVGFRLWAAHSDATWGTIAAEYLLARQNGTLPDFWQNWLGQSYRLGGKVPGWKELGERLSQTDWTRGTVPEWAWFLTLSCDVQEDEVYATVRAWGDGKRSGLVDWFVLERGDDDAGALVKGDLVQLDSILDRCFPIAGRGTNPRGRKTLSVALCGIDAKYRTGDVHQWLLSRGKPARIRAIQGDGTLRGIRFRQGDAVFEARREKADGSKEKYEGGLTLWTINSNDYASDLIRRFRAEPDRAGAWLLPRDIFDGGHHYLKQLVNEEPVRVRAKDGRWKIEWKERSRTIGHDFEDCEKNALCLADMVVTDLFGATEWSAEKWVAILGKKAAGKARKTSAADRRAR